MLPSEKFSSEDRYWRSRSDTFFQEFLAQIDVMIFLYQNGLQEKFRVGVFYCSGVG